MSTQHGPAVVSTKTTAAIERDGGTHLLHEKTEQKKKQGEERQHTHCTQGTIELRLHDSVLIRDQTKPHHQANEIVQKSNQQNRPKATTTNKSPQRCLFSILDQRRMLQHSTQAANTSWPNEKSQTQDEKKKTWNLNAAGGVELNTNQMVRPKSKKKKCIPCTEDRAVQ